MKEYVVLDFPVHVDSMQGLLNSLQLGLSQGQHQHVVTLNPEMLMRGLDDPGFGKLLKQANWVLPDGAGIVWALKRKGVEVTRIPGIEFSEALIRQAVQDREPIALIGATPEVNRATVEALKEKYPRLMISYFHHGFFIDAADRRRVAEECAQTHPRYVFVALGVPGQELWIDEFRPLFDTPAAFVGVGGSFDIWSQTKKRAHPLFLKLNLEWLWRITSEPYRIKRVYKTLPMFVVKVLLHDKKPVKTDEYHHAQPNSPN